MGGTEWKSLLASVNYSTAPLVTLLAVGSVTLGVVALLIYRCAPHVLSYDGSRETAGSSLTWGRITCIHVILSILLVVVAILLARARTCSRLTSLFAPIIDLLVGRCELPGLGGYVSSRNCAIPPRASLCIPRGNPSRLPLAIQMMTRSEYRQRTQSSEPVEDACAAPIGDGIIAVPNPLGGSHRSSFVIAAADAATPVAASTTTRPVLYKILVSYRLTLY